MSVFLKYWDRRLPVNVFAIAEQAGLSLAWKAQDCVCQINNNVIILNDNESINRQRFAVARILADKERDQLKMRITCLTSHQELMLIFRRLRYWCLKKPFIH